MGAIIIGLVTAILLLMAAAIIWNDKTADCIRDHTNSTVTEDDQKLLDRISFLREYIVQLEIYRNQGTIDEEEYKKEYTSVLAELDSYEKQKEVEIDAYVPD